MKNTKILIVDDQVQNLQLLVDIFSDTPYEILACKNGNDAIRIANEEKPELILLDINMPGISGFDVCSKLKNVSETKDIAIIFLSAQSSDVDESYALSIGASDFISKPFSVEIVKQRVKIHLELKYVKNKLAECLATLQG